MIALDVLVQYFKMDFYKTWELLRSRMSIYTYYIYKYCSFNEIV